MFQKSQPCCQVFLNPWCMPSSIECILVHGCLPSLQKFNFPLFLASVWLQYHSLFLRHEIKKDWEWSYLFAFWQTNWKELFNILEIWLHREDMRFPRLAWGRTAGQLCRDRCRSKICIKEATRELLAVGRLPAVGELSTRNTNSADWAENTRIIFVFSFKVLVTSSQFHIVGYGLKFYGRCCFQTVFIIDWK